MSDKPTPKDKLTKLISVKTIVTFVALALWVFVTTNGIIDGEFFKTIFTMIISFYFGTQTGRDKTDG